jgi:hypothetical protein
VGEGPEKTFIDGSGITRVLHIVQAGVSVGLVNLTIQNGKVTNTHNQPHGAGILNKATLSLYNVGIKNNTNAADNNFGGGIYNDGVLTITNATLSGNQALSGGAIFTNNSAQTAIERSFLVSNRASSRGSAIESYGSLQVTNTTVHGNVSTQVSGLLATTEKFQQLIEILFFNVKSLLLSDTLDSPKSSTISERKGSNGPYPILPAATRGKTTAEPDFFLPGRFQGRHPAERQQHPQTARGNAAGRVHRHLHPAVCRGQLFPGHCRQPGAGVPKGCRLRVPQESPL